MPPAGHADLFRLSGPLHYSAVISRLDPTEYLYNRAAVSRSLERLLERVTEAAGVQARPDPKLRHLSLANGLQIDYRLASPPDRPAILLGLVTVGTVPSSGSRPDSGAVLLIQVISSAPEERLRELLSGLERPVVPPVPASLDPPGSVSMRFLAALWLGSLALIGAAMLFWWKQLKRPSRRKTGSPRIAGR